MNEMDTMQNKEILALTQRVIELENKRAGDKATNETLIDEVSKLETRVQILEEARQVQIKLNSKFNKGQDKPTTSFFDFFKRG